MYTSAALLSAQTNVGLGAPAEAQQTSPLQKSAADARDDAEVQLEDTDVIFEHTLVVEIIRDDALEGEDNKKICFDQLWSMKKAQDEGWNKDGLTEENAAQGLIKHGTHCHDC